jgi:hypothetical protein
LRTPSPHTRASCSTPFPDASAEEQRERLQRANVLLTHQLIGREPRKSERDEDPLEGVEGDADLLGQLRERDVGRRMATACALEVAERQLASRDRPRQRVRIDPLAVEVLDGASPHHLMAREPHIVVLEDPEAHELLDPADGGADALGDLRLAQPVTIHRQDRYSRNDPGSATNASWQACEQK